MHFHLPKPLHGWREFAGEVGIIVIGVLIALGAEQVVESWDWNEKVRGGRAALREDFVTIVANAREREGEDQCIRRRLLQLRNMLDAHPDVLSALGHVGSPPARPWYPSSWDSIVASNVSTHMPRDDMLAFAGVAQQAREVEDAIKRESEDWAVLYTMVGPSRRLAAGEGAQLRKALSDAAFQLNQVRLIAPQVEYSVRSARLLTAADWTEAKSDTAIHLSGPNARHICGAILAPDPGRVDAPYDPAVQLNPLAGASVEPPDAGKS